MTNALIRRPLSDLAYAWHKDPWGGDSPNWEEIRDFSDGLLSNPAQAASAMLGQPSPSGSEFFDAFLASLAETLSAKVGVEPPGWTKNIPGLGQLWEVPGTPMMLANRRAATAPAFLARNIVADRDSLWHVRVHGV